MDRTPDRQDDFLKDQTLRFDKTPPDTARTDEDWLRLQKRIQARKRGRRAGEIRWIRRHKIVAAVILFMTVAGAAILVKDLISRRTYATGFGELRQVRLPDSSMVTLNADSRLYFHKDWEKGNVREVWLKGEAFFKVTEQVNSGQKVKFIVHAGNLNIEVLGTQFNVKRRKDLTRVTLTSGKVRVDLPAGDDKDIIMHPGEQVNFSGNNKKIEKRRVVTQKYIAWTEGKLILDHKTLAKVAEIIQETYGKTVVFEDDHLKTITLSGSYPLDNMDKLLHALEMAAQITITHDKEKIIFKE